MPLSTSPRSALFFTLSTLIACSVGYACGGANGTTGQGGTTATTSSTTTTTTSQGSGGGQGGAGGDIFSTGAGTSCTGLECQQVACDGGKKTTLSGTVFDPKGDVPLYNVVVYVPNAPLDPLPQGASCDKCGSTLSGKPIVSTLTDTAGHFVLANVPVGQNIPLVLQVGKWRRQIVIPSIEKCVETKIEDPAATRLPRNKAEGDIPKIALTTGGADPLECLLRKIGIDDAEFTDPSGTGRIRFYEDNGARTSLTTPAASQLYATQAAIDAYDQVIFACIGATHTKTVAQQQVVMNYANKGGRVFATHLSFVWLYNIAPWSSVGAWVPNKPEFTNVTADVDTSFAKGAAFAEWLSLNGALTQPLPAPQIQIQEARHDLDAPITAPAQK
ncbi:MAG: carboxypeptidase-like regulatory domain-containing protein, partial [Minicystis sp.]